jgi:membrane associated rhomboid family serine protease
MGIYDRDYYQGDERSSWFAGRSMVVNLILVNVAIFIADLLFDQQVSETLSLKSDLFQKPWQFWQLLTYGFVHDPNDLRHILFNMFGLWLFGSDVETIYGRAEFLRLYLVTIVLAGLAWVLSTLAADSSGVLLGASGGVMGMMMLFVMHFPRRIFYIWGILPLPAWALGVIYVFFDLMGAAHNTDNVAHVAHLTGAAFGFIYYRAHLNLGRLVPRRLSWSALRWRPKLRVHDPDREAPDLNQQVDQILEKISREGESSLTKGERRTLEEASRRYQRRRD